MHPMKRRSDGDSSDIVRKRARELLAISESESRYADLSFDMNFKYFFDLDKRPDAVKEFLELLLLCFTQIRPDNLEALSNYGKLEKANTKVTEGCAGSLQGFEVDFCVRYRKKAQVVFEVQRQNKYYLDSRFEAYLSDAFLSGIQSVEKEVLTSTSPQKPSNRNRPHYGLYQPVILVVFYPNLPFKHFEKFNEPIAREINPICFQEKFKPTRNQTSQDILHSDTTMIYINYKKDLNGPLNEKEEVLNNWIKVLFRPDEVEHLKESLTANQRDFLNFIRHDKMDKEEKDKLLNRYEMDILSEEKDLEAICRAVARELPWRGKKSDYMAAFVDILNEIKERYPLVNSKAVREAVARAVFSEIENFTPDYNHPFFTFDICM